MTAHCFPAPKPVHKKAKFDPVEKAKKAYYNAKQRCENPNSPDFPKYGGAGIKLLFKSAGELVAEIGLPKNASVSLDRINPEGHYAPGNVRWASKAAQANNKIKSAGGAVLSIAQQVQNARKQGFQIEVRDEIAKAWALTVRILNQGGISEQQARWFHEHDNSAGLLNWSFDLSDHPDFGEPPGVFRLPSLTIPGRSVLMVGGPIRHLNEANECDLTPGQRARRRVFQTGGMLHMLSPQWVGLNVPPFVRAWMRPDLTDPELLGAFWYGSPPGYAENSGWVEGMMMALACHLGNKQSTAIAPLARVLNAVRDTPTKYAMEGDPHPLHEVSILFVPDFEIDYLSSWTPSYDDWKLLKAFLEVRVANRRQTFLGIHNPNNLPAWLKSFVFRHLRDREMPKDLAWHPYPHSVVRPASPRYHLKEGGWDLTRMHNEGLAAKAFVQF